MSYDPQAPVSPQFKKAKSLTLHGTLDIDTDGSPTAFNAKTAAGRGQINSSGPSGFVHTSAHDPHGRIFKFHLRHHHHVVCKTARLAMGENGCFVSQTSLQDHHYPVTDPRRYVNADAVPYIALSRAEAHQLHAHLGDRVMLTNLGNQRHTVAIYGDSAGNRGPNYIEISPPAARLLGIKVDRAKGVPLHVKKMKLKIEMLPKHAPPNAASKRWQGIGGVFPTHGIITAPPTPPATGASPSLAG